MKIAVVFVLICLLVTSTGCMGYREIDKGYFVTAIGFLNQADSVDIFIEAISSSDLIKQDTKRVVLHEKGRNIKQAYDNLTKSLEKPLYYEQVGTIIFQNDITNVLNYFKNSDNTYYGLYVVKTDDVKTLFENDTVNGVLGYDIISLIKTQQKSTRVKVAAQLYEVIYTDKTIPNVNFINGKLTVE